MSTQRIEKDIEVNAPLTVVYDQWTQFEEIPIFMEGVKSVTQLSSKRLAWVAEILGREVEWEAEITEQVPDERIAWRSTSGHPNAGTVYFTPTGVDSTRVTLVLEYEPIGAVEIVADALGVLSLRVSGDLQRFRDYIEERGQASGGWRGVISSPEVA